MKKSELRKIIKEEIQKLNELERNRPPKKLKLTSKPNSFKSINTIDFESLDEELQDYINSLEIYNVNHLYGGSKRITPSSNFVQTPEEMYFILNLGKYDYLVNTEGFGYPRYMAKLYW